VRQRFLVPVTLVALMSVNPGRQRPSTALTTSASPGVQPGQRWPRRKPDFVYLDLTEMEVTVLRMVWLDLPRALSVGLL
jgi:hypothetical protein